MADIDLTTTASVPSGTSLTITVYEDTDGDGSAESVASQSIDDGTNTYTLSGFDANGGSYWIEAEFDHQEVTKTAELDKVVLGGANGGDGPLAAFNEVKEEKLALAGHIDQISQSISEQSRVALTLDDLENRIQSGEVAVSEVVSAVERMILGEDLTELSLAGLSPVTVSSTEDTSTRIGEPSDSPAALDSFDIAGELVENALLLGSAILLALRALRSVARLIARVSSRLDDALDFLDVAIDTVFGAVPFVHDRLEDAADVLGRQIEDEVEGGERDGDSLYDTLAETVEETFRDPIANAFMAVFEGGFDDALAAFDDDLGLDDDGAFGFDGTDAGARDAADAARADIVSELEDVQNDLDVTGIVSQIGDIMVLSGIVLTSSVALAPVGVALAVVGALFSLGFDFLGSIAAADGMYDVRGLHNAGLDDVVGGGA